MSEEKIKVTVCKYPDRKNLVLRFVDPVTGKQKTKSAGTPSESEATKEAGKWEDELRSGRYQGPSKLAWAEFRKRYEEEKMASLAPGTHKSVKDAFDAVEKDIGPGKLAALTASVMSKFQAAMRKRGLAEASIAKNLRHVKAALRWGERQGLMAKAPLIEMPKRVKGAKMMKGRAITAEEFDRLTAAVPKVRRKDAPAWLRLLNGLWLSGLRISEAVALEWNDGPFSVDLDGKHPRFRILGEAQKSGKDELLPMTPDFAQWLLQTPTAERVGTVFNLMAKPTGRPMVVEEVGKVVSKIGKKAGVVVDKAAGKYASAHDLRRAFGSRWSRRVMPAVLQRLMRHSAIQTTMAFYVDLDTDEMAGELWAKFGNNPPQGNNLGNIDQKQPKTEGEPKRPKSLSSNQ